MEEKKELVKAEVQEVVRGFKVFRPDWSCRPDGNFKRYECPDKFEEDGEIGLCNHGMHFCESLADCFEYYSFDPNNKVAEVTAYGQVLRKGNKPCTDKLEIVREIPWDEVLKLMNQGKNCTGRSNTGDWNTGDWNTGNWNTGDWNTGDSNTGNWNTGDWNTGDWNTGDSNTGNWNTGDWNTGDSNTGNWNTGDWNTGDWNKSSFNTGCFMTIEPKIMMFNQPSDWTYREWLNSDARYLLNQIQKNVIEWVDSSDMTDEEKAANSTYKTTGGYLKVLDESESGQIWWEGLSEHNRDVIRALPNFDAAIFEEITGIKVN